jgi:rsbT antagonist protein RsbS
MGEHIPILKLGKALLVTIQVDMHDRLALALEEDLTQKIVATGARGVVIDISALEIVDSFIGRMLDNIAGVSRILDAETVLVGMQPAVAITLVKLGLSLSGIKTALNVERGMKMIALFALATIRMTASKTLLIRSSEDVVRIRSEVRNASITAGFSLVDQTKFVTAASELARNMVIYAAGGEMQIELLESSGRKGDWPSSIRGREFLI